MASHALLASALAAAFLAPASHLAAQGGGLEPTASLHGTKENLKFGFSLATAGDVDHDGYDDLIVGAPDHDHSGLYSAGSAWVFSGADGSLLHRFLGPQIHGQFLYGYAVSPAGDVDGDGHADLLVGAPFSSLAGIHRGGTVFVYSGATGALLDEIHGSAIDDNFGHALAALGDVDGDGFDDFIQGGLEASRGGLYMSGMASVHSGATGQVLFEFHGPSELSAFGHSVAGVGDVTGDQIPDFLVGAPSHDPGGKISAGSAFLYSGSTGQLVKAFDGDSTFSALGRSVAAAGDVNGDQIPDFLIGIPSKTANGIQSAGVALVISGATRTPIHRLFGWQSYSLFGDTVSGAGDLNGDGFDDVAVSTGTSSGSVSIYSGSNGSLIQRFGADSPGQRFGSALAKAGKLKFVDSPSMFIGAHGAAPSDLLIAGSVYLYSFHPYMAISSETISASQGGTVDFTLDFPEAEAGNDYLLLASYSGTGPWNYNGLDLPLTHDPFTQKMFNGPPPMFQNGRGILDAQGDGLVRLQVAPGDLVPLLGRRFWFSAIAFEGGVSMNLASVACILDVVP
ncbi:MAG: hypothetical protein DWQ01_21830 [Planctomycetota bacterium]|nr:MAG: hypothetical protein DWQ01_21830 [Planctomycetota bacterium]